MPLLFSPAVIQIESQPIFAAAGKKQTSAREFRSSIFSICLHSAHTPNYLPPVGVHNLSYFFTYNIPLIHFLPFIFPSNYNFDSSLFLDYITILL